MTTETETLQDKSGSCRSTKEESEKIQKIIKDDETIKYCKIMLHDIAKRRKQRNVYILTFKNFWVLVKRNCVYWTWSSFISIKKSFSSRIGPRCHMNCAHILTQNDQLILWVNRDEISGCFVFITSSRFFKAKFDYAIWSLQTGLQRAGIWLNLAR